MDDKSILAVMKRASRKIQAALDEGYRGCERDIRVMFADIMSLEEKVLITLCWSTDNRVVEELSTFVAGCTFTTGWYSRIAEKVRAYITLYDKAPRRDLRSLEWHKGPDYSMIEQNSPPNGGAREARRLPRCAG